MLKMAVFAPIPSPSVTIATAENAGFLINCRKASRRLLITKRDHWINAGRASRRDETGSRRNRGQQRSDRKINGRVERVDLEQNIFQCRRRDHSKKQGDATCAENKTDHQLPGALFHYHPKNSLRVRTKRHSDAEFLRALVHRKTHHAVETNR